MDVKLCNTCLAIINRVLLLEIADDTSRSELETMKHACIDLLGRQVISKLKDAIQLFLILEERGKLAPTNLKFLHQLLTFCDNRSMLAKLNTFGKCIFS